MLIAVVIPAYNEEERIASTLQGLAAAGYTFLVVVDDGSQDKTALQAQEHGHATVLKQVVNRGMGASLATGTRYALEQGADIIVHFDADGQHDPADIKAIIAPIIESRADIVLGSRYQRAQRVPWTKRYFLHTPGRILQNVLTGIRLSDVHNGLRAMNRHAAESIIITQDRMAHNTEIVAQIASLHLRYQEVPVTIRYQEYGQGLRGGLTILRDLLVQWLMR